MLNVREDRILNDYILTNNSFYDVINIALVSLLTLYADTFSSTPSRKPFVLVDPLLDMTTHTQLGINDNISK